LAATTRKKVLARPLDKPTDPWQISEKSTEETIDRIKGDCCYKGRIGARVEPYGIYWLEVKSVRPEDLVIVENLPEMGRTSGIKKIEAVLESDMIFPIVRGADISRWKATSSIYAVIVNKSTRKEDIPEEKWMKINLPKTYQYLFNFKEKLLERENHWKFFSREITSSREIKPKNLETDWKYFRSAGKNRKGQFVYNCTNVPFYAMFNVGDYTFSPYKLVWSHMSNDLKAAVVSNISTPYGNKTIIPTDTTSIIPFTNKKEAHFVCAILNSSPARAFIKSFSSAGRGFGAPSILEHIGIPKFEPQNTLHATLSDLSMEAHKTIRTNNENMMIEIEEKIDRLTEKMWKIKA